MHEHKGELHLRMDALRKTDHSLDVQGLPAPETWSVQLFRSIDSGKQGLGAGLTVATGAFRKPWCVTGSGRAFCGAV